MLSFWVDADRIAAADAARDFGMSGAAVQSAMNAIAEQHYARWYFLLAGLALVIWFGGGVVRALFVAHYVAWGLRPVRLRRPLLAGLVFSGVVVMLMAVSVTAQVLREQLGSTGLWLPLALAVFYLGSVLWVMDKLPHRSTSWRDLLPGAVLVALGTEAIHVAVVVYLAPKIGRSSELYGALGAATVILLWLYLLARLMVAAAFLNAALWEAHAEPEGSEERRLEHGDGQPGVAGVVGRAVVVHRRRRDAVLAGPLGLIERCVGRRQQRLGRRVGRELRHAEAHRDVNRLAPRVGNLQLRDRRPHRLGRAPRVYEPRTREDDHELLAAEADGQVGLADRAGEHGRDRLDHVVARADARSRR